MPEYPAADVDRIIAEEIMRAEGTMKWGYPVARTRIKTMLISRLCAAWGKPEVRIAIEATAAAETELMYMCTEKDVIFVFEGGSCDELISRLQACDRALELTLAAYASWPVPGALHASFDLRAGLETVRQMWAFDRQLLQDAHSQGKQVSVHSSEFVQMHGALQAGYIVFLTPVEQPELNTQFRRAMKRMREHNALFFAGDKPLPRA